MCKALEAKLNEIIELLRHAFPYKNHYHMNINDGVGTFDYLATREEYLEFLIEVAINDISDTLEMIEGKRSRQVNHSESNKHRDIVIGLEQEIYETKVEEGYNGVEWLILNLNEDDCMYQQEETLGLEIIKDLLEKADFNQAIKDWAHFTAKGFHRKYKINWWGFGNTALVHLHKMRKDDYNSYFTLMDWIYDKPRKKQPVKRRETIS